MDRESLARRNARMAELLRRPTTKQRLRDGLLAAAARTPVIPSGGDSQQLLIIRPDHLGDVLLCTPAIQAIKRRHPQTSIHVLCGEWSAEALANYSEIDRVLTVAFPGFQRENKPLKGPWRLALETARLLRQIGYASAIIMRPDHWWGALVAYLAGIKERVGYDISNVAPFLTTAYSFERRHAVEQNMRLAGGWTGKMRPGDIQLRYPVQAADRDFIEGRLRAWNPPLDGRLICIHPGSGRVSKIWRAENWAAAADELSSRYDAAIVYTGTAAESNMRAEIMAHMKTDSAIIAGATSIGQLAALYERSAAVLGPDSGAMHLAAAMHTPTVALFGPADPGEFAPWGDPRRHLVVSSDIGCRPCRILDWQHDDPSFHPCVREISIEQVLEATTRALSGFAN